MGCTQSKIEDEEAVIRCKERKQHMKDALAFRNAFAAAHSAYVVALKNTGAALSDYAHGEVQNPLQLAPSHSGPAAAAAQLSYEFPVPPPPLPNFGSQAPLQRAVSAPEIKILKEEGRQVEPTIQEGDEEDELESEASGSLRHRSSRGRPQPPQKPPSPPRSAAAPPHVESQPLATPPQDYYDYFFPPVENVPGPSLSEVVEEVKVDKQHIEAKVHDEMPGRVERHADVAPEPAMEKVVEPPPPPPVGGKILKKGKGGSMGAEGKRSQKNINLALIFVELDDHFLKASESAHEVSKMLEATRLHYHSNFADNRGHIDHSARVMRVITWNRSFRGLQNADDGKDDFDSEENETHATVLDKLLAWEKKLYDEVKGGEQLKIDYQKKVAMLNKQKKRSTSSESLEKIKAAVSHLHTRYIVDMQSMDSTVSEINRLRDEQLYPKLVQLVDGMARMWEIMRDHHYTQQKIVLNLKYLDISQSPKETSDHHHGRTIQLLNVVGEWHLQSGLLVDNQRKYVKALYSWLRLNLVPIESSLKERVSSPPRAQSPPIKKLLHAWQDGLEKLPDELARTAIYNFRAVIDTLVNLQQDEIKQRDKCEETRKELARKERSFEDWKRKLMERTTPAGDAEADDERHRNALAEKEVAIEVLKNRLKEEQEAYERVCLQVREKSLVSFRNRMPELFTAMVGFAAACTDMYKELRLVSQQHPIAVNGEASPTE
ncbi:hypothetical protein CRG98_002008 [Punica granatum]|uniref:Nitrate regulatory gene2 protein-like n=1 Tax=Punica granatum TaxID=22663 RepID=A0A2I0LBN9_PUNGR|nr:hypothetical protein CRG98_002008 [Punica granatum]